MQIENKNKFGARVIETGFTLALFFVVFWAHDYLTQPIKMASDTLIRWFEVKRLYFGFEFSRLDPHTMRWAINFPVLVTLKIFGTAASTYYIASSAAVTLAAVLCYKIGRYAGNRIIGLTVLVLFVSHPDIIKSSSQLLPAIFSIAYLLGAAYFCLLYVKGPHQHLFIFISALFLFCAYGAKITNLYFIPAFIVFLYINSCATGIVILVGLLAAGIAIETYWINTLLAEPTAFGRLTTISAHANRMLHGNEGNHSFSGIWTRWAMLSKYAYLHTITAFFASMYFLKNRKQNVTGTLLTLCFLSFAGLITFMVLDVNPISYASNLSPRYLNVTIPLSLLISILAVNHLGNKIYFRAYLFSVLFTYLMASNTVINLNHYGAKFKVDNYQKVVNEYFEQGHSFIFFSYKEAQYYRSVLIADRYSLGIGGYLKSNIYVLPPGDRPFRHSRPLYVFTKYNHFTDNDAIWPSRDGRLKMYRTENRIKPELASHELY